MPALPCKQHTAPQPDVEYHVMASRLPLKSFRALPAYLRSTLQIRKQLAGTDGLIGYSLLAQLPRKTFCTMSAWESRAALRQFDTTDPHRVRVTQTRPHMKQSTFTFWTFRGSELPVSWSDVRARIAEAAGGTPAAG